MSEEHSIICPICNNKEKVTLENRIYECQICGLYKIDYEAEDLVNNCPDIIDEEWRLKIRYAVKKNLTSYIGKNYKNRQPLILSKQKLEEININYSIPTLLEKIDLVMDYIESRTHFLSEKIIIDPNTHFPLFFCKNNYELNQIINYLSQNDYIKAEGRDNYESQMVYSGKDQDFDEDLHKYNYYPVQKCYTDPTQKICEVSIPKYPWRTMFLTTKGLKYQTDKNKNYLNSKQAFVAMWFNDKEDKENFSPDMQTIYADVIKPSVEIDKRFMSVKIDCIDHCNDINDEMIAQIRKSRFMIADLTGYRGGVYFEAGFAYGLGLPVIYTCHKEWLKSNPDLGIEGVHFDLAHRNIILWDENDLEEFKLKLQNRINAIIE